MSFQVTQDTVTIPDFLNLPFLESLRDAIAAIAALISAAIDLAIAGLEVVKIFLLAEIAPLAALLDAIIADIETLLQTWEDAGIGIAYVFPDLSNLLSAGDCFIKLKKSLQDPFDDRKPITEEGVEVPMFMACITARLNDGLAGVAAFIELMNKLFNIKPFVSLYEEATADEEPSLPRGQTQTPDWQAVKLIDAVPGMKEVIDAMQYMLSLLKLNMPFTEVIERLIAILEDKQATINSIVALIDAALDGYGEIAGLTFSAIFIDGQGTNADLVNAVQEAFELVQGDPLNIDQSGVTARLGINSADLTDLGAVVALSATGTSVEALKLVFGRL